jgi:hypothetical protein
MGLEQIRPAFCQRDRFGGFKTSAGFVQHSGCIAWNEFKVITGCVVPMD